MSQVQIVRTQIVDGITHIWEKVPNQHAISGYSWARPSVVSAAGFSSVVPPLSDFPDDVGWPIWGAGLRIVYSHDGPFGIYGSRMFVPFPADSMERRPILVQNYDTPEQILFTSLLSAAGRWTDSLPQKSRHDHGNWWLLRMFGTYCGRASFGYDRKSTLGIETIRAVAAVSFDFHRAFGAIRCSGECKFTRTLGGFSAMASSDEWNISHQCIDPNAPFYPVIRPRADRTLCLVENRMYDVALGKTEMQLPTTRCASHPVCGHCRNAKETRDRYYFVRHTYESSNSDSS